MHPTGPTRCRSQTWAIFLQNHARDIVAVDMFVVPTIRFQVLYIFIILGLERGRLIFANVTTNPTAEWLAQQVVNAFPWATAPRFLIRDRDGAYGLGFSARVNGLGIREIRTAVRAPPMNAFAERLIGTLRRECFDHVIVLSERHARRLLREFRDCLRAPREPGPAARRTFLLRWLCGRLRKVTGAAYPVQPTSAFPQTTARIPLYVVDSPSRVHWSDEAAYVRFLPASANAP